MIKEASYLLGINNKKQSKSAVQKALSSQVIRRCYIECLTGDTQKRIPRRLCGDVLHVDVLPVTHTCSSVV